MLIMKDAMNQPLYHGDPVEISATATVLFSDNITGIVVVSLDGSLIAIHSRNLVKRDVPEEDFIKDISNDR